MTHSLSLTILLSVQKWLLNKLQHSTMLRCIVLNSVVYAKNPDPPFGVDVVKRS